MRRHLMPGGGADFSQGALSRFCGDNGLSPAMEIETVLQRFTRVKKTTQGWSARCPAHDDRHNSLTIRLGRNGDILLRCHAGAHCDFRSIAAAAGLEEKDLWGERSKPKMAKEAAVYDYRDESGSMLFQVVRFEPKDFRQRRPKPGGGWEWGLNGARRVLYRLPELVKGSKRTVLIVEGEKDVDRLLKEGLLATCNPMGAGKWSDEYSALLKGRTCIVIPDNDKPGEEHAIAVRRALADVAEKVVILQLEGTPDKGDVSDWLDAGHTADELKQLCKDALAGRMAEPAREPGDVRTLLEMAKKLDRRSRWLAVRQLIIDMEVDEVSK